MRKLTHTLIATVALAGLAACSSSDATGPGSLVSADGVVRYVGLEGGFYSLQSIKGKFDPMNLPADYQQDGLQVHFVGTVRDDMVSVHLYGPILELSDIRRR